jgi:hypothetical protein
MILVPLSNPKFANVPAENRANFGFAALEQIPMEFTHSLHA